MKNITAIISLLILYPLSVSASIELMYNDRVPYMMMNGDELTGLTGGPVVKAFEQAGINFNLKKIPTKRQMHVLKENKAKVCAIGWFKKPDREQFAHFSAPIYRDKPMTAIANADNDKISSGQAIEHTLSDPNLKLLVKDGFSYGEFIDDKIKRLNPKTYSTVGSNLQIIKMISSGRADYTFITEEEFISVVKSPQLQKDTFKVVRFNDMPEGNYRYLLCSFKVEKDTIDRINANL
ncbi:substrate-binding periplasmic protein [Vibrio aquimaris]|uniref:Bacterial extracellular solute-binding protein, family 3 n=1 Tax=Vibrio aquimaris TaxID=2587862 RepID=A0A5P9CJH7_9VIBR|nr:transporter substrate-binding domain-containing protein [Vibrio aquimaris]QFT26161.1 Bacterial extracellular solute-binding protein, family 3 [Vibrio aquimaris]